MKKKIILLIAVLMILLIVVCVMFYTKSDSATTSTIITEVKPVTEVHSEPKLSNDVLDYDLLNDNILNAGPPKDGIPPIDSPVYISMQEADNFLEDFDKVFVYESQEDVFIYPQKILVWHEIVNDDIDGLSLAVTYCPLTGSTICYLNDPGHDGNTFGTSGNLLNSNLVMYDRSTESYVPQILGIGITGALEGQVIQTKPIHWSTWTTVQNLYSDAKVLSTDTGYLRDYTNDPYGTYEPGDTSSYYTVGVPFFPLLNDNDGTFDDKHVVIGVKAGKGIVALEPSLIEEKKILSFKIDKTNAVAFYDQELQTVRVYDSSTYTFSLKDDQIQDQNGDEWSFKGIGPDESLTPLTYFDVMWFAWHAYYPNTEVIK